MPAYSEQIWRASPADPVTDSCVLFVPPLFDEANRMRRTLVLTARRLAASGIPAIIPDLPGQNESLIPTRDATISLWRAALADILSTEPGRVLVASVRGGTLIDGSAPAAAWWRLAPVAGASLLRSMLRAKVAGEREAGNDIGIDALRDAARETAIELAGNILSPTMVAELDTAVAETTVAPLRSVTLGSGDAKIAGAALWLRSEPGEDAALVEAMAQDITEWMRACALI